MNKPVISWDGKNLPRGLEDVPPGQYVLEPVQDAAPLSEEEDRGIQESLRQLDAGMGKSLAEVLGEIRKTFGR